MSTAIANNGDHNLIKPTRIDMKAVNVANNLREIKSNGFYFVRRLKTNGKTLKTRSFCGVNDPLG